MGLFWRRPAGTTAERCRRRVVVYLIPFLFFLYILAYLDRTNVAVAALGMSKSVKDGGLGFDKQSLMERGLSEKEAEAVFPRILGFGGGIFFWGYWILEIPSTLSVLKWGARYVFVRILVLWGLSCAFIGLIGTPWGDTLFGWLGGPVGDALFAVVNFLAESFRLNPGPTGDLVVRQFYFLRFMLGFFEGGFFPSVILYLTLWFPARDRAKAIATFMAAIPVSSIIGAPISTTLLHIRWLDLPGWRWIFILQGLLPVVVGFVTFFFLPDRPEKVGWLPPDERDHLLGELHREHLSKQGHGHWVWLNQAGGVLLLTGYYFCMNVTSYGLSIFMPKIIQSQSGLSDTWSGLLSALPYLMALVAMLVNGAHSDRTNERIGHTVVPLTCLSVGLFLTALLTGQATREGAGVAVQVAAVLAMIFLVGTFMYAHLPAFWPIPSMFLGAAAAASAIGFINMIGNLGGFFGPAWVGEASKDQVSFAPALLRMAPFPLVAVGFILVVGFTRRKALAQARAPQMVSVEDLQSLEPDATTDKDREGIQTRGDEVDGPPA
jgi:MFS transporter, ACS family, tartrate transporter